MTDFNPKAGDEFDRALRDTTTWADVAALALILYGLICLYSAVAR